jgi:hypothetical protein
MNENHHGLPLLGGIAGFLHWLESLAVIASGPLLTVGLGIALVDLLTDGALLTNVPALLFAWAVSQAIGVDAQLVGSSFQLAHSLRGRRYLAAIGYCLLVIALGYVGFIAAQVFATQEAEGITTAQALGALGLDSTTWIVQRSALSVALVVLSGLLRYVAPAKEQLAIEDERAQLARELELEPLRQQARAMKATGMAALARSTLAAARGAPSDPKPTGPGTPVQAAPASSDALEVTEPTRLRAVTTPRQVTASGRANRRSRRGVRTPAKTATVERQAREAYAPGMSVGEFQKAAKISRNAAGKWRKVLLAEAAQQQVAQ